MNGKTAGFSLFLLRIAMGWLFLYSGITKLLNPEWSAVGYLTSAKTFPAFYKMLAGPEYLDWINFLNIWGLTIIGAMLILGIGVFLASLGGFALMILYYFPVLEFPYIGAHSYMVDEHIIYALVFLVLILFSAGQYFGIDGFFWKSVLPNKKRF